jgi:HEAT repeat protein
MNFIRRIFGGQDGPSEGQIKRALKKAIQIHGDASVRVGAMEQLAAWKTPASAAALLRRFTVQVPQATMDLEEKQYTVRLLAGIGRPAVDPILQFLRTQADVTWPMLALKEILPEEEYRTALKEILDQLASGYTRWPEAKTVLIDHLPPDAFSLMRETVEQCLEDEDDDVCISAAGYLARNGDDDIRERLIQLYLGAEYRPRVRGQILDLFVELQWPVKGYRKKMEEALIDPYYLTSKGTVKRRRG